MERIWVLIAGLLVGTAVVLLWRNNLSAAFVTGTLGVVSWFLSYRMKLRAGMRDDEELQDPIDDMEDSEDTNET
jgi:hypothetical protein